MWPIFGRPVTCLEKEKGLRRTKGDASKAEAKDKQLKWKKSLLCVLFFLLVLQYYQEVRDADNMAVLSTMSLEK